LLFSKTGCNIALPKNVNRMLPDMENKRAQYMHKVVKTHPDKAYIAVYQRFTPPTHRQPACFATGSIFFDPVFA